MKVYSHAPLFLILAIVYSTLHTYGENTLSGSSEDNEEIRPINIAKLSTNSFEVILKEYKRTHHPMIWRIMLNRANSEVSEQIDKEICDLFKGSVSIENALLLRYVQ